MAVVLSSLLISLWGNAVFEMDKIMQGMFGGPLLGLFLLGLFTTRGTAGGATVGVMCSCLLMGVIVVASVLCPTPEPAAVAIAAASAAAGSAEVAAGIGGSSSCGSSGVLSWLGRLSFFWYPVIGSAVSFTVGWLASRPWEGHARAVQNLVVVLRRHTTAATHTAGGGKAGQLQGGRRAAGGYRMVRLDEQQQSPSSDGGSDSDGGGAP